MAWCISVLHFSMLLLLWEFEDREWAMQICRTSPGSMGPCKRIAKINPGKQPSCNDLGSSLRTGSGEPGHLIGPVLDKVSFFPKQWNFTKLGNRRKKTNHLFVTLALPLHSQIVLV